MHFRRHQGLWTIFSAGQPVASFRSLQDLWRAIS